MFHPSWKKFASLTTRDVPDPESLPETVVRYAPLAIAREPL
jgi:hypothetical protein